MSGSSHSGKEWAGVGFVVSPKVKALISSFNPASNRISSIKLKAAGGFCWILSVLARHNLKPLAERLQFYDDLDNHITKCCCSSGPKFFFGDFNARIGQRRLGEDDILGEHCFGREARHPVEVPNRDLLIEWCCANQLRVANTHFRKPAFEQVTYHEPIAKPMDSIHESRFTVLDLLLTSELDRVVDVFSDRLAAIASHHFPIIAVVDAQTHHHVQGSRKAIPDWAALKDCQVRNKVIEEYRKNFDAHSPWLNLNSRWEGMCQSMGDSIQKHLPCHAPKANKPWIQEGTLDIVHRRLEARAAGDHELEKLLHKQAKTSARKDRSKWLEDLAGTGDWTALRRLKRVRKAVQTRLRDESGETVFTDQRAEVFARHLQNVQWRVRHVI